MLYAEALANRLSALDFAVFLDQWGAEPGAEIPAGVYRVLRRSAMLVCISSAAAAKSSAISAEIALFKKSGRPIIPVDIDAAIESADWFADVQGLARTPDTTTALQRGTPSEEVVRRIQNAFRFTRRNKRIRLGFSVAFTTLACTALAATYQSWQAQRSARAAQAEQLRAERATERAAAQEQLALSNAQEADRQKTIAEQRLTHAEEQEAIARLRAEEAQAQQRIAQRQTNIANARQLAARSRIVLTNPRRMAEGLGLAVAAAEMLAAQSARSFEVDAALRDAIAVNPKMARPAIKADGRVVALAMPDNEHLDVVFDTGTEKTGQRLFVSRQSLTSNVQPAAQPIATELRGPVLPDALVAQDGRGTVDWPELVALVRSLPRSASVLATDRQRFRAAVAREHNVDIVDLNTSRTIASIPHPKPMAGRVDQSAAVSAAFAQDGESLAVGYQYSKWRSLTGAAAVWSASDGNAVTPVWFADEPVTFIMFSPRNKLLWGHNRATNMGAGPLARRIPYAGATVAFSADEKFVATSDDAGLVTLWRLDGEHEREVWRLLEKAGPAALRFAPNGRWIATASNSGQVRFWLLPSEQQSVVARLDGAAPNSGILTISPDAKLVATVAHLDPGEASGELQGKSLAARKVSVVQVFAAQTGRALSRAIAYRGIISKAGISPNGRYLATAGEIDDKTLTVWDIGSARPLAAHELPSSRLRSVAFSNDSSLIAYVTLTNSVYTWPWASKPPTELGLKSRDIALDPRRKRMAYIDGTSVRFHNLAKGGPQPQAVELGGEPIVQIAFSPDGAFVAVETAGDHRVWVWDIEAGTRAGLVEQLPPEGRLGFDSSGAHLTKTFAFSRSVYSQPWAHSVLLKEACDRLIVLRDGAGARAAGTCATADRAATLTAGPPAQPSDANRPRAVRIP